jgi:ATP-dependent DNA helicase DinG
MDLGSACSKVSEMADLFTAWSATDRVPLAKWVQWASANAQGDIDLCASPLTGAQGLHKGLWRHVSAAVCTSATLRACESFDYFGRLSGLNRFPKVSMASMPSPFDYQKQGTLRLPKFRNSPKNPNFSTELCRQLPELLSGFECGQLVLFTSKRQMQACYDAMPSEMKGIVLLQGSIARSEMLAEHRRRVSSGRKSVIFGLQSLGEGLDLPGKLCEQVVIDRLPFTPPTSPVDEALSEWLQTQNRSAFDELVIPRAAMRLAQWVGRAVRTVDDHATITICDNRLPNTGYGRLILSSLPNFSRAK